MKVYLWPTFGEESGQGGIKRVLEALQRWLPEYGVELVDHIGHADLVNAHADSFKTDLPIAESLHGLYWSDYSWPNWSYEANRRLITTAKCSDSVSVPSRWVAESFRRGMLLDPWVLPHGIESDEWYPEETEPYILWCKTRPDPICDPKPLLQLARMLPYKNFVTTFGDTDLSNVKVLGKQPLQSIAPYIRKASLYLGTVMETGGITCLEAMASGVPVLGFNWGVNPEIIVHKETGYLVEPGDYGALRDGAIYCLENRKRLGEAARQHVLENFLWRDRVAAYIPFFESALGYRKRPVKVSIVVTAYNLESYLPGCLDSLIAQTFKDWECIIVDDHSPDSCGRIAEDYVRRDSRFRVIHNPHNLYLAEARNMGFRGARGEYFLALDADDALAPHTLRIFTEALDGDKNTDIVTGGFELVEPDGRHWISKWPTEDPNYDEQIRQRNQVFYASMYRRWVWERTGGYRRRYRTAEDADFWTRAMSFGAVSKKATEAATLIYANRPGSMSHEVAPIDWTSWFTWSVIPEMTPYGACASSSNTSLAKNVHIYGPPDVSIVVPCGPGHDVYLQDLIDSAVAQTYLNWELIVVNDTGVSWFDESGKLINKYLSGFPFVRVIEETPITNRGVAWARNTGIRASKAPYFVLMDADDYMQPVLLDSLLNVVQEYGGWVYSDWYKDGGEVQEAQNWDAEGLVVKMLGPVTGIYKKSDWEAVGGFDEEAPGWEDWDWQLKLLELGICGTRCAQPLFTYRYRTGNRREEGFSNAAKVLKYIKDKHKDLNRRETIMACRSCGGGGGAPAVQVISSSGSANTADMALIEFVGAATQTMSLTSKVNRTRKYRFGGERGANTRRFYVYKADVEWIVSMRDFVLVEQNTTIEKAIAEVPVLKDSTPAPSLYDRPISDLNLAGEITTALTRAGYTTIGDIKPLSLGELVSIRGLGPARARKLQDAVAKYTSS